MRDLVNQIADDLALTTDERSQEIPSGGTRLIANRVHWAKTYLKQAGLLEQPDFHSFLGRTKAVDELITGAPPVAATLVEPSNTPEEQIAAASRTLDEALRGALLARILEGSPAFFEKLIVDLLLAMGYGGSRRDAGEQLGGTGDGGVDGVICEDQLGLDRIYLQAKRYRSGNTVGSEAVQAFIGALVGKGAQKGVFITTSTFSKAAVNAANQSGALRLVLIDGEALTNLMVRFGVGLRIARTVEIKRVDLDYFEDVESEQAREARIAA